MPNDYHMYYVQFKYKRKTSYSKMRIVHKFTVLSMAPIIIALNIYICSLLEDEHHKVKLSWGDTLTI